MENDNKLQKRNVQTYTGDMVKTIESDKRGLIKKIIHEEEGHEAQKKNLSPKSSRNRFFMFISIILVLSAIVLLIFLVFFTKKNNTPTLVTPQNNSIIFTDETSFSPIDGFTKEKISETALSKVDGTKVKIGGIEGIYLTESNKVLGLKRFLTLLKSNFTLDKTDFINDNFLFGVLKSKVESTNQEGETIFSVSKDSFMLLKTRSFADILPSMRSWETKMLYDLSGFFRISLKQETNYLFTKDFEDSVIFNKNARILKDNEGKTVLMYVFIDDTSVIITNSELAVQEVMSRLASSKIKK